MNKAYRGKKGIAVERTYKRLTKYSRAVRCLRAKQNVPIKISKSHLRRVLTTIKKEEEDIKKYDHKMIKEYGPQAQVSLHECILPSTELLGAHFLKNPSGYHMATLLQQLRRSLLDHDWSHSCQFLRLLISCKQTNKRILLYIIRTTLIILLNHHTGYEIVEEFLTISLGLIDDTKINDFIKSLFVMPERMKLGIRLEMLRNNGPISAGRVSTSSKRKLVKSEDESEDQD